MTGPNLDRATDFNDQLIALVEIGLPIDLGFPPATNLTEKIRHLTADFTLRLSRGSSWEAILNDEGLPSKYRAALRTWLDCDQPTVVFDAISQPGRDRRRVGSQFGQALIYPMIVGVIAFLGFIFFCVYLFPKIEGMYRQIDQPPSAAVAWMQSIRAAMPVWVVVVPTLLLVAILLWRSCLTTASWRWLPGSKRYFDLRSDACYADQIATQVDQGVSRQAAVELLKPISDPLSESQRPLLAQRPLLNWAVQGEIGPSAQAAALRFTSNFYRRMAIRRSSMWRVVLPSIVGVALAGLFVLAFGLSLFLPVTELLHDIGVVQGTNSFGTGGYGAGGTP